MKLELREITPSNWKDIKIEVTEEQRRFVASITAIFARAYVYRNRRSAALAIYSDGEPIGLLMQRDYEDDEGRLLCILDQFLIHRAFQGRGYGKAAMQLWLAGIRKAGIYCAVQLCFIEGNYVAECLYKGLGFIRKPQCDDDEEFVMEYLL